MLVENRPKSSKCPIIHNKHRDFFCHKTPSSEEKIGSLDLVSGISMASLYFSSARYNGHARSSKGGTVQLQIQLRGHKSIF